MKNRNVYNYVKNLGYEVKLTWRTMRNWDNVEVLYIKSKNKDNITLRLNLDYIHVVEIGNLETRSKWLTKKEINEALEQLEEMAKSYKKTDNIIIFDNFVEAKDEDGKMFYIRHYL